MWPKIWNGITLVSCLQMHVRSFYNLVETQLTTSSPSRSTSKTLELDNPWFLPRQITIRRFCTAPQRWWIFEVKTAWLPAIWVFTSLPWLVYLNWTSLAHLFWHPILQPSSEGVIYLYIIHSLILHVIQILKFFLKTPST